MVQHLIITENDKLGDLKYFRRKKHSESRTMER